jgi:hypothetical protein
MNSVDPQPTSPSFNRSTKPVFPFSRQGVILAKSVSPFWNLEPLLNSRWIVFSIEALLPDGYFGDTVPVISRDIVPLSTSKDRDKD